MDIQKYIDSGILEDYVLGLVSEAEAQTVEKNVAQYPELKAELNKIEDALATYAQAKARPMPAGLSASILEKIQQLEAAPSSSSDQSTTAAKPKAARTGNQNLLSIILGIALLSSLLGGYILLQQKRSLGDQLLTQTTELNELNDRMTTLQLTCDEKDGTIERLQEQITILKNPAYRPISMQGTDRAPDAVAVVYFNPADQKTYLDVGNLPAAPSDRDYQLWAIVDGQPTDMGVIDLTTAEGGLVVVPHIRNPQAFAMTLETKGGNPAPNLDELYVIGNV
ncbi:MAG: anti-sigma factor [Bacteroidota bacterium]